MPQPSSLMVYDKNTLEYKSPFENPYADEEQPQDFFNDHVRIVVPNKRDAKGSRVAMPGTGNRYFTRGTGG